ncbi:MAG: type IV secretory system conjugative DNA transfer family protein, partial [Clostridia bacterium]
MVKNSITDEIKSTYKQKYLENASKISYTDLQPKDKLTTVLYKDLPNTVIDGYPIASDYVGANGKVHSVSSFNKLSEEEKAKCNLRFHYLPFSHELCIGTTGSGKTTGCIEPQLRAISSQKNKPNIFITDPKGELFERNARHLDEQGYKIFVLNFKDITHSDKWNPLLELYEKKMKAYTLGDDCKMRIGKPNPDLILNGRLDEFNKRGYIEYDGHAFPNGDACDYYISFQRDFIEAEIDSLVNQFANLIIKVQSKNDASWEYGALQLVKGLVLCMLDDAVDPESGFTKDMMTLNTIQQYYVKLRSDLTNKKTEFDNHPLLANKSKNALIYLRIALNNAPNTMLS